MVALCWKDGCEEWSELLSWQHLPRPEAARLHWQAGCIPAPEYEGQPHARPPVGPECLLRFMLPEPGQKPGSSVQPLLHSGKRIS
jgi:hypothetical protein